MKNYKFTVAYDGSRFHGFEKQPNVEMTIQGKLESVLSIMTESTVEIIGAGRTDAGVHARAMICNAHLETDKSENEIRDYMNHYLPDDICICEVKEASDRFHARYKATGKTYVYTCYIGDIKPVFNRKYVYVLNRKPDVSKMQEAAKYLIGTHDFKSFCGNPKMKKSTVREIDKIEIVSKGSYLTLSFHGTGFLQNMVRILTGTLLEVGWGKKKVDDIPGIIDALDRQAAGFTAPAIGLCLMKVDYN